MDRERRERQKSIRAARDWLTGAEHALAGEDDLAGDLKLMLARAELARIAAHRRARLRRWASWLLPPIAAAAVWAWIAWTPPHGQEETTPAASSATIAEEHAQTPAPEIAVAAHTPEAETPVRQEQPRAESAPQASEPVPAAPAALRSTSEQPAKNRSTARVPSTDMQRLMQVGGKILRE